MSKHHYTQCRLEKDTPTGGVWKHTAWIPSEFAKVGRLLDIEMDGEWSEGWRVTERYATMDAKAVEDKSREHKHAFASIEGR